VTLDENLRTIRGILSNSNLELFPNSVPTKWNSIDLPLILVPLEFLRHHVVETARRLTELISRVEQVERTVAAGANVTDLQIQIKQLHSCNTALIMLERRWHFQSDLGSDILEFLNMYKKVGSHYNNISIERLNMSDADKDFRSIDSQAGFQKRVANASEYDLKVLSRRIGNQFTAVCIYRALISSNSLTSSKVFNLITQYDAQANVKIAKATLSDSSSMKTIAALTLVFLPATFICVRIAFSPCLVLLISSRYGTVFL
jgi:hypothetical protein